MNPGIYYDLPFAKYLEIDAVSNSGLGQLKRSPLHYRTRTQKQSTAFRLGSLTHAGALEPLSVAKRYAVMPRYELDEANVTGNGQPSTSVATKYVKEKQAEFRNACAGKEIIGEAEYDQMAAIVASLQRDLAAWSVLAGDGAVEVTLVWEDPETGLKCKARMDKLNQAGGFADLKTTADLARFERSIATYGYHRQVAHYQAGYAVLTGELLEPWLVAVESNLPYAVAAAPLHSDAIEAGERERRKLLEQLVDCQQQGSWPGPAAPEAWNVPAWALDNDEPLTLTIGGQAVEV